MFGYIKPYTPEMKIKEHEAFKSIYCGLCRQLGKSFKSWARLTLNYDFVFLAMLYYGSRNIPPKIEKGRCVVNPLSKVLIAEEDECLEYAADVAMIMLYYKIYDNTQDSRGGKKALWKVAHSAVKSDWKKASGRQNKADEIICRMMEEQREVESDKSISIDRACNPTANALSRLMGEISEDDNLARLGYFIGRFIYLCDALEDMEDDIASGNYNPFVHKYITVNNRQEGDITLAREAARDALYLTIGELDRVKNEVKFDYFTPIIYNILEFGMTNSVNEILNKKGGGLNEPI